MTESFLKKRKKKKQTHTKNQYIERGHSWQGKEPAKYEVLQD